MSLMEAINTNHHLPHFLIVILDRDLIGDVDNKSYDSAVWILRVTVRWLTRQIKKIIARKCLQLMEKRPGSIYSGDPKIVYVRMLHHPTRIQDNSLLGATLALTAKFNSILNEAVTELEQNIMTIVSCNLPEHFDHWGNLVGHGYAAFWHEMDDLLDKFDDNKVKLVPNQQKGFKNQHNYGKQPRKFHNYKQTHDRSSSRSSDREHPKNKSHWN